MTLEILMLIITFEGIGKNELSLNENETGGEGRKVNLMQKKHFLKNFFNLIKISFLVPLLQKKNLIY